MSNSFERGNQFQVASDKWKAPSRAMLRKAYRAVVYPGFPVLVAFTSMDEVDAYLSGDKIQCLLCGKLFNDAGKHIRAQHGMPPDEYRQKYGIPYGRSLCSISTAARYSQVVKLRLTEPGAKEKLLALCAKGRATQQSNPSPYRPNVGAVSKQRVERITVPREYTACCRCGTSIEPAHAASVCDGCRATISPERRRESSLKHYYKDIERSRASLRVRAERVREKKRDAIVACLL